MQCFSQFGCLYNSFAFHKSPAWREEVNPCCQDPREACQGNAQPYRASCIYEEKKFLKVLLFLIQQQPDINRILPFQRSCEGDF